MTSPILQRNRDIRSARGKIPFWLIAEKLGVHENTLRGWMRKELPSEKKMEIFRIIKTLESEVENVIK